MVQLNDKGEVADFQDENQFEGGKTAYACVAFSSVMVHFAGQPGHGPTGNGMQISNLAYYWYGRLEGSDSASNTSGMSLDAEYEMLSGLNMSYQPLGPNVGAIKGALQSGYPVLLCGAETGMHDLDLGDRVPYSWPPSGNHCIVASGIASDGNLLVHDCASIAPTGVRPGPRRYDVNKLQIVSATAVIPSWLEDPMAIDINSPNVGAFFTEQDAQHWLCKTNGKTVHDGMLGFYKANNGLTFLGLPLSNEVGLDDKGNTKQFFERGCLVWDPQHKYDNPPGGGSVYMAHVYAVGNAQALGEDPLVAQLQAQLAQAQQASNQDAANKLTQLKPLISQASTIIG